MLVCYYSFSMGRIFRIFKSQSPKRRKTLAEYEQEMLIRIGREQFKKLLEKGLSIPVGLL